MEDKIKIRFTGDSRTKLSTRGITPPLEDGVEWAEVATETLSRQKTNVVVGSEEEAHALLKALDRMLSRTPRGCVWMTSGHVRAFKRVNNELIDACKERQWCGYEPPAEDVEVECPECGTLWTVKADAESTPCTCGNVID